MIWPTFIIYLSLIYIAYYILNLLYDLNRSKNNTSYEPQTLELFYHETASSLPVVYEEQEALEPQMMTSMAVTAETQTSSTENGTDLKTITAQAKSDLKELNKAM
jgi:hypothetical protein